MPRFVTVKFKDTDTRTYTYEWDGDTLFPGDRVKVPDNRSDGWKRVTVVEDGVATPPFPCKPIIGRVEDVPPTDEPTELDILDSADLDRRDDDPVVQF